MITLAKKINKIRMEKAQTMVEFALVFPIILLITYGIIEFGRMVFIYAAVTGSAREGARYGAAVGEVNHPQYADCSAIRAAVRSKALLMPNIPDSDITIWYDHGDLVKKADCPPPLDPHDSHHIILGDRIIVTVTTYYSPWIAFLGLNGFNITSSNARTILVDIPITPYP
jgi:hypothetical protein